MNSRIASEMSLKRVPSALPRSNKPKWLVQFDNWMVSDGRRILTLIAFILVQIGYFAYSYYFLMTSPDYRTVRGILGYGLYIARGSANLINLNMALILFTMCRNLITLLRATQLKRIIPFDDHIFFHMIVAYSIAFWSITHAVAHYVNYLALETASKGALTITSLSFTTGPGITGHILLLLLLIMFVTAIEKVRRAKFEVFWYIHHLFILFFLVTALHGAFCFIKVDKEDVCNGGGSSWKWFAASGAVYALERILREWRGHRNTEILKVIQHPSKVVQIQINKTATLGKPGQYVFICCPELSLFQWHPFTLTSAPQEDYYSVHIRLVGDWTRALANRLGCNFNKTGSIPRLALTTLPMIMVDGPYGTASEDVYDYEVSVLIGAGIGVTPFSAILKDIWHRFKNNEAMKLRKVYFFWITRETQAFEWFQDLLHTLEEDGMSNLIEIHTYVTQRMELNDIKNIIIHDTDTRDAITRLRARTHFGRPNVDKVFERLRMEHPRTDIGVFYCGPKQLSGQVNLACTKFTESTGNGARFFYGKENF